jgi:hypothetical protein
MTGEEWLSIALDLHALSCDVVREGIRQAHAEADAAEVERLVRRGLELATRMSAEGGSLFGSAGWKRRRSSLKARPLLRIRYGTGRLTSGMPALRPVDFAAS